MKSAGCRWLTPVILATQEAEIWRITVRSQPGQILCKTPPQKNPSQKRAGGVAYGVSPEFKSQYYTHTHTQKENERKKEILTPFSELRNKESFFLIFKFTQC
jgi:hypothetical protein